MNSRYILYCCSDVWEFIESTPRALKPLISQLYQGFVQGGSHLSLGSLICSLLYLMKVFVRSCKVTRLHQGVTRLLKMDFHHAACWIYTTSLSISTIYLTSHLPSCQWLKIKPTFTNHFLFLIFIMSMPQQITLSNTTQTLGTLHLILQNKTRNPSSRKTGVQTGAITRINSLVYPTSMSVRTWSGETGMLIGLIALSYLEEAACWRRRNWNAFVGMFQWEWHETWRTMMIVNKSFWGNHCTSATNSCKITPTLQNDRCGKLLYTLNVTWVTLKLRSSYLIYDNVCSGQS